MRSRTSESSPEYRVSSGADPLAAIILLLRPQAILSKVVSGAGRYSVRYERHGDPGFCLLLQGSCFLNLDDLGVLVRISGHGDHPFRNIAITHFG